MVHKLAHGHLFISGLPSLLSLQTRVRAFPYISLHFPFLNVYLGGSVVDVAGCKTQGPDWRRLTILFLWYLMGIPIAYTMQNSCSVGAPGTWARAGRVFIEGVVAFGLGGFIYVGIKVLRRLRFIILRLTGAGPMSVPNLPFTPGILAVCTRKSATYSPRRRQVRWGHGVCMNICPLPKWLSPN